MTMPGKDPDGVPVTIVLGVVGLEVHSEKQISRWLEAKTSNISEAVLAYSANPLFSQTNDVTPKTEKPPLQWLEMMEG